MRTNHKRQKYNHQNEILTISASITVGRCDSHNHNGVGSNHVNYKRENGEVKVVHFVLDPILVWLQSETLKPNQTETDNYERNTNAMTQKRGGYLLSCQKFQSLGGSMTNRGILAMGQLNKTEFTSRAEDDCDHIGLRARGGTKCC